MKRQENLTIGLLKTFSIFFLYFIYTYFAGTVMKSIGIKDTTLGMFIADIIFLVIIVWTYAGNIKDDYKRMKKDYPAGKLVKTVLAWVGIIFLSNILMGFLTNLLFPNLTLDENTTAIFELAPVSMIYTIFKTMIFSSVAEELLFRESLSEVIKNDWLFIIISALIYMGMNFIFTDNTSGYTFIYMLIYLVPGLISSYVYTRHERNILLIMLIKFGYNLIPLMLLLLGI